MQFSASRCCIIAVFQVILLGFVTIAFCFSSQQVFFLVFHMCHLRCSNGCFETTWNLYWILLKNRRHYIAKDEILETSFDKNVMRRTQILKILSVQVPHHASFHVCGTEKTSKVSQNHKRRMRMSHFGSTRQVRLVV